MSSPDSSGAGRTIATVAVVLLLMLGTGVFFWHYLFADNSPPAPVPAATPAPQKPAPIVITFTKAPDESPPPVVAAPPPAEPPAPTVSFNADIEPIFQNSCLSCHSGARASGRLNLASKDGVLAGGRSGGRAAIAGRSDQSLIVLYASDAVRGHEMPPLRQRAQHPALTQDQVATIRAWIDQGAQ